MKIVIMVVLIGAYACVGDWLISELGIGAMMLLVPLAALLACVVYLLAEEEIDDRY